MRKISPEQIDAILPQTQCGLCSYKGCKPYAEAIAHQNESLALCPPGGVEGLKKLGRLVGEDVSPFIPGMELKEKPTMVAKIREHECIGCTKCIQACPVDAIMGAAKLMHTVLSSECTGCELCIQPCPVDCIDMIVIEKTDINHADYYRMRYEDRKQRLNKLSAEKNQKLEQTLSKSDAIQAALNRQRERKQGI
jgi:electron transport complex protein RnfB